MRINTNLTAMNTFTQYTKNQNKISSAVAKLSSGYAINTAADNAAGLAISEKMRAQIRGLDKASANSQDAISLVQTAEGALDSSTQILQRMRELAVQSSSDTNNDAIDRTALQDEFTQLQGELDNISSSTTFNKKNLLDGSLSSTTKSVANQALANTGMTLQIGNASAGSYNFSVTTKLKSAAVTAVKPSNPQVTLGTDGYFTAGSATIGTSAATSSLLNGNYTLSGSYSTSSNQMTVTATGDNNQTFTATLSQADLAALSTSNSLAMKFESSPGANDGFTINMTLKNNIASTTDNYNTLASEISKTTASVSGGVTGQNAVYGVYANMTGASSVELKSGMSSVTFDNGVKVNFSTLTAASVDPTNNINISTATTVVNPTAANTLAAVTTGGNTIGGVAATAATMTITDASKVIGGNFTITSDSAGVLTAVDAAGNTFTAGAQNTTGAATESLTYTFTNTKDSSKTFTAALGLTFGSADASGQAVTFNGTMTGARGYALSTLATGGSATLSNVAFTSDSAVANGALALSSSDVGGTTTFTATDHAGAKYTASVLDTAMASGASSGAVTNALTFVGTTGTTGFTANLTTTNAAAVGVTFTNGSQANLTAANAGHSYELTFGGSTTDLSASTTSTFDVKSSANAGLTFQVGANEGDTMTINIDKMDGNYLGVASASVATKDQAASAINSVDKAINQVSAQRATLGAVQNRLQYKIDNLNTSSTNLTAAESQIRDVDMAKEMTEFTNANILSQASTAMLAQANSLPQSVLSLIGK